MKNPKYKLRGKVWLYPSETAAWHFLSVPKKETKEISRTFGALARGWGSLPVTVIIGKTKWQTSIFPDRKSGTYLLPLKAEARKKEGIKEAAIITFSIEVIT